MNPKTEPATLRTGKKPRFALLLATGFGLGYLPKAPGTWGSLGGLALGWVSANFWLLLLALRPVRGVGIDLREPTLVFLLVLPYILVTLGVAFAGVWAGGRAAQYFGGHDPQMVVIDEVSGQLVALLMCAGGAAMHWTMLTSQPLMFLGPGAANWKYYLLGFILFRVLDIWKPFPARQAEALPGGWGIMADDWVAGVYAALGLWLARALGL